MEAEAFYLDSRGGKKFHLLFKIKTIYSFMFILNEYIKKQVKIRICLHFPIQEQK